MRRVLTIPLTLCAFFALTGLALAGGNGPAAGEEYILDIPGAGGNEPGSPSSTAPDPGTDLPTGTEEALLQEGADGAAAADLARGTGPQDKGDRSGNGSNDGGDAVTGAADADGGSGIGEVVGDLASGSDSGMGLVLPIVLVLALGAALALVAWRRSASGS
jgi:hypothetical protein